MNKHSRITHHVEYNHNTKTIHTQTKNRVIYTFSTTTCIFLSPLVYMRACGCVRARVGCSRVSSTLTLCRHTSSATTNGWLCFYTMAASLGHSG
ncbi:hypothetical protein NP493_8g03042 [Ridgeia piscesae]|uniref:Uncharacterized protein n=1 Tax=Ridgeia piscesae TaxID=27915 RepID=A0AAD9UL97_RIDPI|nr:hypothetical protein NP493_8g03042 [Ridgeia piscesae]